MYMNQLLLYLFNVSTRTFAVIEALQISADVSIP